MNGAAKNCPPPAATFTITCDAFRITDRCVLPSASPRNQLHQLCDCAHRIADTHGGRKEQGLIERVPGWINGERFGIRQINRTPLLFRKPETNGRPPGARSAVTSKRNFQNIFLAQPSCISPCALNSLLGRREKGCWASFGMVIRD
jgi:hypothetical protein